MLSCHPPMCFGQSMTTTAQTVCALRRRGVACKHDDEKLHASYLCRLPYLSKCTHLQVVGLRLEGSLLRMNLVDTLDDRCLFYVTYVSGALLCRYSSSSKSLHNRFMHLTNYTVNRNNSEYQSNSSDTIRQGHKWSVTFTSGSLYVNYFV